MAGNCLAMSLSVECTVNVSVVTVGCECTYCRERRQRHLCVSVWTVWPIVCCLFSKFLMLGNVNLWSIGCAFDTSVSEVVVIMRNI